MTDLEKRIVEVGVGFDIGKGDDESVFTVIQNDTVVAILYGDAADYVISLQQQLAERDKRITELGKMYKQKAKHVSNLLKKKAKLTQTEQK